MARRGENIYKRKDGRWEGRYIAGRRPDGRALYRSVYGGTYQDARRRLEREKAAHAAGKAAGCRLTLEALCAQWLESVRCSVKESSFARYSHAVRKHIVPYLGHLRPEQLTANVLSGFVNGKLQGGRLDRKGGLAPKTVRDVVVILKAVLKQAGLEYAIPVCAVNLKLPKAERTEAAVLSDADVSALEAGLRRDLDNVGAGLLLCLYTGLRLGEVCALRWSDVDWDEGLLHVRRTAARLPAGGERKTRLTVTSPKTGRALRTVALPRGVAEALRRFAVRQDREAYVLTGKRERMMDPRTYQYRFQRTLKQLNIPHVKFHALRHTYATQCVRRGVDVKTLSEALGHSTVKLTLDRYVHPSREMQRRQFEDLDFRV